MSSEKVSGPDTGTSRFATWRRRLFWSGAAGLLLLLLVFGVVVGDSATFPLVLVGAGAITVLVVWLFFRLLRRLLWSVGRRLAFTYFLVGVLPIPMVAFLLLTGAYLLGGFFLGHVFRDSVSAVHREVSLAAEVHAALGQTGSFPDRTPNADIALAHYLDGHFVGGDPRAPELWPDWLLSEELERSDPLARAIELPPLVAVGEDLTLAGAAEANGRSVVAWYDGHLETRLRELGSLWVELIAFEDERSEDVVDVYILGERFVLQPLVRGPQEEDRRQFVTRGGSDPSIVIQGFDVLGRIVALETGEELVGSVAVSLAGTTNFIFGQLFSSSREVDTLAWLIFVVPAFLLFDLFAVAWIMAVLLIFSLTRAVNRLSRATVALREGDFRSRIPVRRSDQIGELQTSFNDMAEGLERSLLSMAQKESLEKEIAIARDLQKSLLPSAAIDGDDVEFATFFEPSAAIGGDYFDILRLDHRRLAVIIADVSGHGLSAGLRMAMLKSALLILVEQERDPEAILRQLDRVVRSSQESASFVTATLAILDLESGRLELTNAAHPPTYVLRGEEVREIVLPGVPLGALGHSYGSTVLHLAPGDTVVWLSDGFIEAADASGDLFGYDRTRDCLAGVVDEVTEVRDRLLENVAAYTGGIPAQDDRTLVVMRFLGSAKMRSLEAAGS